MKKIISFVLVLSFIFGMASIAEARGGGRSGGFGGSRSSGFSAPSRSVSPAYVPSAGRTSGFTGTSKPAVNTMRSTNANTAVVNHNYYGGGGYGGGSGFFTGMLYGHMLSPGFGWGGGYGMGYGGYGMGGGGMVGSYAPMSLGEMLLAGVINICLFIALIIVLVLVFRWLAKKLDD